MIGKDEVLLKNNTAWQHYSNPHCIISVTSTNEVLDALREIEKLVNKNNWHAAGFVSYEAAPAFDSALQIQNADGFPLIWFGLYPEPRTLTAIEVFNALKELPVLNWKADVDQQSYTAAIEKIKNYIAHGNTYQVNYTMRLDSEFSGKGWDLFLHLAQYQNKYAGYINTGQYEICSASPELFFKLDGEKIYSLPMKGTVKRGRTTLEDKEQAEWLHKSQKNRAENVMIIDMVRNDLGRIAEIGSVQVPELFKVEKYPTLFQMTSVVQAKTLASITEIFSALFPCASITGAPKISTMNIIAELETTPRKIYTGSIGYISPNRKAQFNVAIRTILVDRENKSAEYGIGGGIVWDSTSTDEYSEALLKAQIITKGAQEFSLLETLLWTPPEGYFLLEKHIERINDSAEYFDIPFSKELLNELLDETQRKLTSPQRIRLLLDRFGKFTTEAKDLPLQKNNFVIKLADKPIDSSNSFYFHKTTRRDIYPQLGEYSDVLLYNEKNELTEFTIGNLVAEIDGKLVTPPISCGLLAGTFRSHLLETGQIEERIIDKDALKNFPKLFLINSVRKWVEVKI